MYFAESSKAVLNSNINDTEDKDAAQISCFFETN